MEEDMWIFTSDQDFEDFEQWDELLDKELEEDGKGN